MEPRTENSSLIWTSLDEGWRGSSVNYFNLRGPIISRGSPRVIQTVWKAKAKNIWASRLEDTEELVRETLRWPAQTETLSPPHPCQHPLRGRQWLLQIELPAFCNHRGPGTQNEGGRNICKMQMVKFYQESSLSQNVEKLQSMVHRRY